MTNRIRRVSVLAVILASVVLWVNPVSAQDESSTEKKKIDRSQLRYTGRSFDEWTEILSIELDPAMRQKALTAIVAFGTHGYENEAYVVIERTLRHDDSPDLRQQAFKSLEAFVSSRPDELLKLVMDRVAVDGWLDSGESRIVASLLRTYFEPTVKKLLEVLPNPKATQFCCSCLGLQHSVKDRLTTILPAAEIADEVIPVLVRLSKAGSQSQRLESLQLLTKIAHVFGENGNYASDKRANIRRFECSSAIGAGFKDEDASVRDYVLGTTISIPIKDAKLAKSLLAELDIQTKQIQRFSANMEDPSEYWKSIEAELIESMRSPTARNKMNELQFDRIAKLIQAIALQGEHSRDAIPLLELIGSSAENGSTKSRIASTIVSNFIKLAIMAIEDVDSNVVKQLQSWNPRDVYMRTRSGGRAPASPSRNSAPTFNGRGGVGTFGGRQR